MHGHLFGQNTGVLVGLGSGKHDDPGSGAGPGNDLGLPSTKGAWASVIPGRVLEPVLSSSTHRTDKAIGIAR